MYADPTHIRDNEVKIRLNDTELALVDAAAQFNEQQRAVFVRNVVLAGLQAMQKGSRALQAA